MKNKLFPHFNFLILDDSRFKEESVREELIVPLLQYIGYRNTGLTQVIRNHGLKHPFVSIGSTRRNITLIPDYLLKVQEKPAWVLEAKSPSEPVNLSRHVEQAYSYAIHPEIRVNYFALCNGREFVLYNISEEKPMLQIPMQAIDQYKDFIKEIVGPSKVFQSRIREFSKDLGLHIKRLGFTPKEALIFLQVKPAYLVKYNDNLFSFPSPVGVDEQRYMGSFDFDAITARQLKPIIGDIAFEQLMQPVQGSISKFHFEESFYFNIEARLPQKEILLESKNEIYLPLAVNRFIQ